MQLRRQEISIDVIESLVKFIDHHKLSTHITSFSKHRSCVNPFDLSQHISVIFPITTNQINIIQHNEVDRHILV